MPDDSHRRHTDDLIFEMARAMGEMQGTLKSIATSIEKIAEKVDDHEGELNRTKGYVKGAFAIGGTGLVGSIFHFFSGGGGSHFKW